MHVLFIRRVFFPFWVACILTVNLYAQQTDSLSLRQLSEVEVVEKLRPVVTREAAPIQIMERVQIDRMGIHELSEVVKRFSGVTLKDYGGIGGLKTVAIRGFGTQHTAVSYDGVTITDAQSGQIDISRFSLDNIQSVSLVIGQGDEIFQSARLFASVGSLNMKTAAPLLKKSLFHIAGQVKSGSFGWVNTAVRYEQKLSSRYALTVDGDWQRADGQYPYTVEYGDSTAYEKRKNSDVRTYRMETNLYANWDKQSNLQLKGYYFDSNRGLPGSVVLYNDYQKERLQNRNAFGQAVYTKKWDQQFSLKGQAKIDYAWTRYQDFHSAYEDGQQTDIYKQKEYYLSATGLYQPVTSLSFSLAQDFFVNTLDATTPRCVFPTRYTSLTAVAAHYQTSRLSTTASLLNTFITEEFKEGEPAADRKRLSPSLSISYRILREQNLRIRFSYKDIFRTPTFNDLYYDRMGNRNLEPEKATQYNAGITWSGTIPFLAIDYLSITADGYYNEVKNKIVAIPTMFIWKMMNVGKVNVTGADINLSSRFRISPVVFLQADASYSWQEAVDRTEKDSKIYGHQIPYTPVHSGNVSVSIENPLLNITWGLTAVGERYSLAQNIEVNRMDKYIEQQIAVNRSFQLKKVTLRLQAEVLNLGNITYDVIRYYPMPGRSFRAGIKVFY
ncbi:MAG: TonB-dependent receptor [Tannerellaceae bacterium]|nr:TonB-dependent receptor [Tannerellaceae bacterium]